MWGKAPRRPEMGTWTFCPPGENAVQAHCWAFMLMFAVSNSSVGAGNSMRFVNYALWLSSIWWGYVPAIFSFQDPLIACKLHVQHATTRVLAFHSFNYTYSIYDGSGLLGASGGLFGDVSNASKITPIVPVVACEWPACMSPIGHVCYKLGNCISFLLFRLISMVGVCCYHVDVTVPIAISCAFLFVACKSIPKVLHGAAMLLMAIVFSIYCFEFLIIYRDHYSSMEISSRATDSYAQVLSAMSGSHSNVSVKFVMSLPCWLLSLAMMGMLGHFRNLFPVTTSKGTNVCIWALKISTRHSC